MSSEPVALHDDDVDLTRLKHLVERHASAQGRFQHVLPWVRFYRSDTCSIVRKGQTPSLWIGVVLQGAKRMRAGGRELVYGPGSYIVLGGELDYESCVVEASPSRPYLSMGVVVPPEIVAETWSALADAGGPRSTEDDAGVWVAKVDVEVVDVLCRLLRSLDDPGEQRVIAPLAVKELVFRLLRSDAAAALRRAALRDGDETRIHQAMSYIRAHAAERLTVAKIARAVKMSPSHFAHRFRDVARVSPMRYLKHVRLHSARTLLVGGGLGAAEAAARVGYASPAQFTRDFKAYFELPPSAYARRFRGSV